MEQIKSLERLRMESAGDGGDFFIVLGKGSAKSSKWIRYLEDDKVFSVFNEIDNDEQELTEAQIMDEDYTLIGKAMVKGALFKY